MWMINTKSDRIMELETELGSIEKPYYTVNKDSNSEHKYFKYAGVEFSFYTSTNGNFGCGLIDSKEELMVYCDVNKSVCKVESRDFDCLDKNFNMSGEYTLTLGSTGCIKIFEVSGKTDRRIY